MLFMFHLIANFILAKLKKYAFQRFSNFSDMNNKYNKINLIKLLYTECSTPNYVSSMRDSVDHVPREKKS